MVRALWLETLDLCTTRDTEAALEWGLSHNDRVRSLDSIRTVVWADAPADQATTREQPYDDAALAADIHDAGKEFIFLQCRFDCWCQLEEHSNARQNLKLSSSVAELAGGTMEPARHTVPPE